MNLQTFTTVHVIISLIGIATGLLVFYGLLTGQLLNGWNGLFLTFTILTSVTGFFFPFTVLTPAHKVGIISLVVLAIALLACYAFKLAGIWGRIYVITAILALYLNVFVLVVQLFLKVPAIKAFAPTQTEPPFLVAQLAVLLLFVVFGAIATIRFRGNSARRRFRSA